ncbi:IS5 family transposase [Skermanella aerolata]|uniref:IS5 family transposase n=1 Tax=Skermanella aerolata TaxID=393310 RepID=UPI003D24C5BA
MPHKYNAARRHHIARPKRRVTNWSEYNEALRQRGSLTMWFTDAAIAAWKAAPRTTPGGQPHYSDLAITTALTLRAVFHLALRQTEGLIGSILQLLGLDLSVPDYSTLSRRARNLDLPAQARATGGPIHLLVDSSGLKLSGPGEWLVEKHGTSRRRSWRKLHIGFDAVTGWIVASLLTDRDVDDASQVEPLLDEIVEPVELFLGDGGYDRTGVYTALEERHPAATVVVPPRSDAVLSATADTEPNQRDRHIQVIAGKGRIAWQRDSGYNERARVEGQFARWKQVIGDGLRFHSDEARVTEVAIAAAALNRMLDLGRPNSVRVA